MNQWSLALYGPGGLLSALEVRHGAYPEGIREAVCAIEDSQKLERLIETAFRSDSIETFALSL